MVSPRTAVADTAECDAEAVALHAHLAHEAHRARRWNTAWAVGFGVTAGGQLALAATRTRPLGTFDADYEETLYVGAAKTTIAFLARAVMPLRVSVPALAAYARPCAALPALYDALDAAARVERRTFWLTHLGGLALNLSGMALLTSRRSFRVGLVSLAIALPVAPAVAYTQPRASWHRWRRTPRPSSAPAPRRDPWIIGVARGALADGGDGLAVFVGGTL